MASEKMKKKILGKKSELIIGLSHPLFKTSMTKTIYKYGIQSN